MYYPADGDRVVITHHSPGTPKSSIGTVTDVTPFEQDEFGTWMGGWMFTGHEMGPGGKEIHTAMACPEAVLLHHGAQQSVRPATPDDELA